MAKKKQASKPANTTSQKVSRRVGSRVRIGPKATAPSFPPSAEENSSYRQPPADDLQHWQHVFSYFMQHLPGLAWIKDADGRYVFANAAALGAFGRTYDVLYGHTDDEIFPPNTAAQFKNNDQQALRDSAGIRVVETLQHPDGVVHHSIVAKFPITDLDGAAAFVGGMAVDITEQKETERVLQLAQEQLQLVTASMSVGVTRCSRDLRYLWVNEHYARSLGYVPKQIIGQPLVEILGLELFEQLHHYFQQVLTGQKVSYEQEVQYPGLPSRWIKADYTPTYGANGEPDGWVAVISDITERKRAEEQLLALNSKLEALVAERTLNTDRLLEEAPDGIIVVNQQGRIIRINQQTESLFGYSQQELLGQPVEMLLPEEQRVRHNEHRAAYFAKPRLRSMGSGLDLFGRHQDGHNFAVEIQLTPLVLSGERLAVASIRDVTEANRARDIERRLAAIMQSNLAAIVVLDTDGRILHWNRGAEQLYGYAASEAIGKKTRMLIPTDKLDEFTNSMERLLHHDVTMVELETVRLHRDRTPIDVTLTLSLIKDGAHRPVSICAIHRDIRERKRLEQQMAELIDSERQRLGRELHDSLGQECTAMGMLVTTLKQQLGKSPKQREVLERLEQCAETAKKQLRQVTKGLFPVDLDADGLYVALEDLAEETQRVHHVVCHFECPTPIRLRDNFVATQVFLIVREAVHNAVKHASARRILIRVEDRDTMRIAIRDDGVGLSSAANESTGMGLRIMHHRCSLIGGRLQLDSTSGGTSVTISLRSGQLDLLHDSAP